MKKREKKMEGERGMEDGRKKDTSGKITVGKEGKGGEEEAKEGWREG